MTFTAAFTAMEALNWTGAGLKYRAFATNNQAPYPADLPCVVTLMGEGNESLESIAVDASRGLAYIYMTQILLVSPITIRPTNPLTYIDSYLGLWVGNLTLGGALVEPIKFQLYKAGVQQHVGNNYWGMAFRQRWACEVS